MITSRRNVLLGGAALAALVVAGCDGDAATPDDGIDQQALLVEGPLGDVVLGDPNAPVTIVEYASMTCPHCAAFHAQTFPQLKETYIDTGMVKFIMREYPLDDFATAAFMLARCLPEGQYHDMVSLLFERRDDWVTQGEPEAIVAGLRGLGRQVGFTDATFDACLSDQDLLDGINWEKNRGTTEFQVAATPTFFVNGERVQGEIPFDSLSEIIERHLAA